MTLTGFDQIFGQSHAIDWLCRAYLGDRMPHGLIFAGPVGVGKATTARALSALFLCQEPKSTSPCNRCASCTTLAAGNHPDYHLITKELIRAYDETGKSKGIDLSIKVIRPELVDAAGRKSFMGRGKVFIIKQAELMNVAAQNAMLKTLEEPLGRTLIVLLIVCCQPRCFLRSGGIRRPATHTEFLPTDHLIPLRNGPHSRGGSPASTPYRGKFRQRLQKISAHGIRPVTVYTPLRARLVSRVGVFPKSVPVCRVSSAHLRVRKRGSRSFSLATLQTISTQWRSASSSCGSAAPEARMRSACCGSLNAWSHAGTAGSTTSA